MYRLVCLYLSSLFLLSISYTVHAQNNACSLVFKLEPTLTELADQFERENLKYIENNFFSVSRFNVRKVFAWNEVTLNRMAQANRVQENGKRKATLGEVELRELFDSVLNHPVASLKNVERYECGRSIGFCFGRAMTAHLQALMYGVEKTQIKKVWAIGELVSPLNKSRWSYHVTTIVRGKNGDWYAIDPIIGEPITVTSWFKYMKKFDSNGRMAIFVSDPSRLYPNKPDKYTRYLLSDPDANGYYKDLLTETRQQSKKNINQ